MKINPINQNNSVSAAMNINSNSFSGETISVEISDTVELSAGAQKYSDLVRNAKVAMDESDAQEAAKISDISSRLKNNAYQVSEDEVVNDIIGGIPSHI